MTDRRFIEETFPVKEVSAISTREKSIRHGHISTLHLWAWKHKRPRRPLAAIPLLTPPLAQHPQSVATPDFLDRCSAVPFS